MLLIKKVALVEGLVQNCHVLMANNLQGIMQLLSTKYIGCAREMHLLYNVPSENRDSKIRLTVLEMSQYVHHSWMLCKYMRTILALLLGCKKVSCIHP